MIDFSCGGCGKAMQIDEQYAGRKIKCKACGQQLRVPDPPPEPPEKLRKKFGGKKRKRKIIYWLACLFGLPPIGAMLVLAHWLAQDLTCDGCGYKTNADALEPFLGFCPECTHYYFSGDVTWSKSNYVVPLIVVTVTSETSVKHSFRGTCGWDIVVARRKFEAT
ncbi:MAG: hypothetical protein AB7N76_13500 [Planctomycetota bacterium]